MQDIEKSGTIYQIVLIALGLVASLFFGVFVYREAFPEYKIYQKAYIALEDFRATYTHEPPPEFAIGIRQIVETREDNGPPRIDRCVSCHVALTFPHFSPTKIARDAKGNIIYDKDGIPEKVVNEDDVWLHLENKINELEKTGRLSESNELKALKTATVDGITYDVTKVLRMHPLIGRETRPFEFHPVEEYGCTTCHNGNGLALTTAKAHGPVVDGQYAVEFEGPVPKFTETDEANDPRFSKLYNGKPGHDLLFQTTPLFVGPLIQAKCVQCHQSIDSSLKTVDFQLNHLSKGQSGDLLKDAKFSSPVENLIQNFKQGQQLFISQACYACHRITGFSRGGVGPELTEIGKGYPWYIKQKIVWPQSTLRNSTMPQYHLDHPVIENLMTFLLAQTGENRSVSDNLQKIRAKEWEGGKKNSNEKPISPSEVYDLRKSMTIFATEGCTACHRLRGFESDVGFTIEKENPDFKALYQTREWFKRLVPETISGSKLAAVIDLNAQEIDKRISNNVRKGSILEEIRKDYPYVIESFYTDFAFAARAKNQEYLTKAKNEKDPVKSEAILKELEAYKARVHRVLMVYIQEYGFGRVVGPLLHWSGVYRSDEWLMQHFRNPTALSPNSIMPIFPFDDTKFYALTYMLDVLSKQNRNATREIWETFGFNPEIAYQIHCSQCHGPNLSGNGPVAEWIYPIPKNLKRAEFLRNLTKENAADSIMHGVKGTPMAPWGEAAKDKITYDGIPVLEKSEVRKIVDWLFSLVPGEKIIEDSDYVSKWQYGQDDIHQELKDEGSTPQKSEIFSKFPENMIKSEYYTKENIEEGKKFFEVNCAVCHGKEGDGSGARSSIMQDAKPRKLTNLEWLNSRDDLRLLRSIKYGVAGTAMGAWGDLTTSLQRIQLVVFIRSISQNENARKKLLTAIYEAFDNSKFIIEKARSLEFNKIEALQNSIENMDVPGKTDEESVENFKQKLKAQNELVLLKNQDQRLELLQELNSEIGKLYQQIGLDLVDKAVPPNILDAYVTLIRLNVGRYRIVDGKIMLQDIIEAKNKLEPQMDTVIRELNVLKGYEKLKESIVIDFKKIFELMQKEHKAFTHDAI